MSETGIAIAATDKIVLAVISHLNEGNIEDAVALGKGEVLNDNSANRSFVLNSSRVPWSLKLNWSANVAFVQSIRCMP